MKSCRFAGLRLQGHHDIGNDAAAPSGTGRAVSTATSTNRSRSRASDGNRVCSREGPAPATTAGSRVESAEKSSALRQERQIGNEIADLQASHARSG